MFSICSFNLHSISSSVWLHTFTILDRLCHLQLCWKRRIEVESQTVYLWSLKLHLMSRSFLQATTEEEGDTSAPIIREGNKIWCWKCKYTVFRNPYWHWRSCVWKHLQLEVKISRLFPSPVQWVSYKTVEMFSVCERLQQVAVMITQQLTSRSQRCGWNVTFKISNLSFTRSPAPLLMLLRPHLVADCREKQLHFDQVGWKCWRWRRDKNTLLLYWLYVPTDLNWNHTAWHHLTECILIYVSCYRVCVEQEPQWRRERAAVS